MARSFDEQLDAQLQQLHAEGLHRELRELTSAQGPHLQWEGKSLLNFSSNDYLGLANHSALKTAARDAVELYGTGSGASRLICGSLACHHELERTLAEFKQTEAALSFSSGYAAAIGTVGALAGKDDIVIIDRLVHASLVDAARLSGAQLRVFRHNDLEDLERILKWAADHRAKSSKADITSRSARILIITESVFSMDGDLAPLREIAALKDTYEAWLMVDEAHATGLYGRTCSGLVEEFNLTGRVEVQMATLGKALGAAGGAVCGSQNLIELLVNQARTFIFSTAPAPAAAAAATAAIRLLQTNEGRALRDRLWALLDHVKSGLISQGWELPPLRSAIVPLLIGSETKAMQLADALRERGVFIPGIRYPSVGRNEARLRLTVTAAHQREEVDRMLQHLTAACAEQLEADACA